MFSAIIRCGQLLGLGGILCLAANGDVVSTVYISLGPNPSLSPSYSSYTNNAQTSLRSGTPGQSEGGSIDNTPTAYNTTSNAYSNDIIVTGNNVTSYNSWRGNANPTGNFANEFGTAPFFSVIITGTNISLSQVGVSEESTDRDNFAGNGPGGGPFTCSYGAGSCGSDAYAADKVGITSGNVVYNSGQAGTLPVDEIILTGVAIGFDALQSFPAITDPQANMAFADAYVASYGPFTIQTCFTIDSASDCGTLNVTPIPEPGSLSLLGLGLLGFPLAYRRFRRSSTCGQFVE